MFEPHRFFPYTDDDRLLSLLCDSTLYLRYTTSSVCLVGPPSSNVGSLAFLYGYSHALEGKRVSIILHEKCFNTMSPPVLVSGQQPCAHALELMKIKYLNSAALLRRYFASIHLLPDDQRPEVIIVDQLSSFTPYVPPHSRVASAGDEYLHSLAFVLDGATSLATSEYAPLLFVCDTIASKDITHYLKVVHLIMPTTVVVSSTAGSANSYSMKIARVNGARDPLQWHAEYLREPSGLVVDAFQFDPSFFFAQDEHQVSA